MLLLFLFYAFYAHVKNNCLLTKWILALSRQFIIYLNRDDYNEATGMFNTVMKGLLPGKSSH